MVIPHLSHMMYLSHPVHLPSHDHPGSINDHLYTTGHQHHSQINHDMINTNNTAQESNIDGHFSVIGHCDNRHGCHGEASFQINLHFG